MSALVPLAGALLVTGCLAYVAYPIYAARRAHPSTWRRDRLRLELTERKEALYAAIVELQFDRDVGKVPEDDHRQQRQVLEGEALQVLSELENLGTGGEEASLRVRIEREVAGRRPAPNDRRPTGQCPACNAAVTANYRFCPDCGAPQTESPS